MCAQAQVDEVFQVLVECKHLWAPDGKSEAVLALLLKSLIAERFARAKEIRAESEGQQRKFNIFFPWWFGVMNVPWAFSGCLFWWTSNSRFGLCMKIDKNMRNDLLEQAWPSPVHLEVQWERAKSSQSHSSSELLGSTSSENIEAELTLLCPFPPDFGCQENIRSSFGHWISFWSCWLSSSPFYFWLNLE